MRLGNPASGDVVFRHIIYPLAYSGKKNPVFAPQKIIKFVAINGVQHTSLAWRRFLPIADDVHDYGCSLSAEINKKKTVNGVLPAKSRHLYVGAYAMDPEALADKLRAAPSVKSVKIIHDIENELIAHIDLSVELDDHAGLEGAVTELVDRIWAASSGPLRHVCACDADYPDHPSFKLDAAPLGDYVDTANVLVRWMRIWRCRLFFALWKAYCPAGKSNPEVSAA